MPTTQISHDTGVMAGRVAQLIDRLGRLTRELQYADGLNPAQWEALRYLSRANRYSRTPGALAEYLGTTKGTVSQTLIALEQKGLLTRTRSIVDRRQIELDLTAKGSEFVKRDPIQDLQRTAASMSEGLGPQLVQGLTRLLHDLQKRHGIAEFGVCEDCTLHCVSHAAAVAAPAGQADAASCGVTNEVIPEQERSLLCINFKN